MTKAFMELPIQFYTETRLYECVRTEPAPYPED